MVMVRISSCNIKIIYILKHTGQVNGSPQIKPTVQTIPTIIVFLGRHLGAKSRIPVKTVSMIANWESKPKTIMVILIYFYATFSFFLIYSSIFNSKF